VSGGKRGTERHSRQVLTYIVDRRISGNRYRNDINQSVTQQAGLHADPYADRQTDTPTDRQTDKQQRQQQQKGNESSSSFLHSSRRSYFFFHAPVSSFLLLKLKGCIVFCVCLSFFNLILPGQDVFLVRSISSHSVS